MSRSRGLYDEQKWPKIAIKVADGNFRMVRYAEYWKVINYNVVLKSGLFSSMETEFAPHSTHQTPQLQKLGRYAASTAQVNINISADFI